MSQGLDKQTLSNGLVVLGEPMEGVASVAFGLMIPAGAARFPEGCCGVSGIIADWIFRGAGSRDSRQLGDALDGLGLHRHGSTGTLYLTLGAAMESGSLAEALDLYTDVICTPTLADDQFELARQLAVEDVKALDDDPRHKVMIKLREQFYPDPLGRSTLGNISELESLTPEQTRSLIHERFDLSQGIFSVAGRYDFDLLCRQVERSFGASGKGRTEETGLGSAGERYTHIPTEGAQVHIGLVTPTITPEDPEFYDMRVAVSILSGGMSSRLFTEVREKRGLCYAVNASYHGLKQAAGIQCYAGTTPDKAQETVDVIVEQFRLLREGVTEDELARAKVGLKSVLIMQSGSSSSRASSIGNDYYMYGRVRPLDEIKEKIDAVTTDSVAAFLAHSPFDDFTAVTVGPTPIKLSDRAPIF